MNARTTRSSARRPARKRVIDAARRSLHPPILDPQRRRVLVAGRHDVDQPFRQHVAVRAKVKRQGGELLRIEHLPPPPPYILVLRHLPSDARAHPPTYTRPLLPASAALLGPAPPQCWTHTVVGYWRQYATTLISHFGST